MANIGKVLGGPGGRGTGDMSWSVFLLMFGMFLFVLESGFGVLPRLVGLTVCFSQEVGGVTRFVVV